ncbi:uncharacterized protein C8A04DRAFT_24525 [Dichotomopilus funicola]|uniref:Uncharacterized protein n=1 Tax=Dichotomopilus funicola TaxID=1934379 RepID=A0AAN6V9D1_9PEZI|nr:hypothetical protein C8A04DRAFT_24525 [Dichotomopilus funicola]
MPSPTTSGRTVNYVRDALATRNSARYGCLGPALRLCFSASPRPSRLINAGASHGAVAALKTKFPGLRDDLTYEKGYPIQKHYKKYKKAQSISEAAIAAYISEAAAKLQP